MPSFFVPFALVLVQYPFINKNAKNFLTLSKYSLYIYYPAFLWVPVAHVSGAYHLRLISSVCHVVYIMRAVITVMTIPIDFLLTVCLPYSTVRLMSRFYGT